MFSQPAHHAPSLEDKFASGPRVVELEIEGGVMTSEDPFFMTYERTAKGLLVEITSGGVAGEVLPD